MKKEQKSILIRVSPELKFQIEKAVVDDNFTTINSWLIHIIESHLKSEKNKGSK